MKVAIDFGISNTDIAVLNGIDTTFLYHPISKKKKLDCLMIKEIFSLMSIPIKNVELIGVTGGKSSDLDDLIDGIKIIKINEIDAIGPWGKKTI